MKILFIFYNMHLGGGKLSRVWAELAFARRDFFFFSFSFFLVQFYLSWDFQNAKSSGGQIFSNLGGTKMSRSGVLFYFSIYNTECSLGNIHPPMCDTVSALGCWLSKQWLSCGRNRAWAWPPFLWNLPHLPWASFPRAAVVTRRFSSITVNSTQEGYEGRRGQEVNSGSQISKVQLNLYL